MNGYQKQVNGDIEPNKFYSGPTDFNAVQFHFHAGSEHTVDGYRFDLEMHTVHTTEETMDGIAYGAVGILFDTKFTNAKVSVAEQRIIDNFFDSLQWDNLTGKPQI